MKYKKKNKIVKKQDTNVLKEKSISKTFFEQYLNKHSFWFLLGFIIIIGFIGFGKYITSEYLFFFKDIGSDSLNQNYPAMVQKTRLMLENSFGKWSFFSGMGESLNRTFATNPLGWFIRATDYIGVNILGADYFIAERFLRIFILQFLFSGTVFYFYLRTISIKKFSSIIGALVFTFSGFMVVGSSWGFSGQVFSAIFLLFAFEQLLVKKRWYFFPFAVMFLSGNTFELYIYTLFIFFYSLFRYFSDKENSFVNYLKLAGQMILLAIIGLLMNAVKVVTVFQKLFFSSRMSGNASYSQVLSAGDNISEQTSLGATTLLRFFSSDILGTGSDFQGWQNYFEAPLFYIGLLILLLVPQVFIHLNKRKKIIFGSFLGFWILTLLFPYLRHAFLAFTGDYFRYGFDFFIPFTFLFFSIYALNELDKNFKLNLPLLGGTLLVLLGILLFPYKSIPTNAIDFNLRKIIIVLLMIYSALIFLMSKKQYKSIAQIGIIILLVVELGYFSYKSYASRIPVTKAEFEQDAGGYKDGTIQAVEYLKTIDEVAFYRTEKDYQSGNAIHGSLNDAQAQGYYGTTSYSSFNQLNYIRFLEEIEAIQKGDETATRWVQGFRGLPLLQTFGNIKYLFSKEKESYMENYGFDSIATINDIKILRNRFYLPFGYTYDKYIDFEDFKSLISYRITSQSIKNINQEFARMGLSQIGMSITNSLKPIENKGYNSKDAFVSEIKTLIGKERFENYELLIIKHSVDNFKNQIALLNTFVYEKDANIDISKLKKILATDTNIIISVEKFNFEKYEQFVNDLKVDTLQITKFENSKIEGTIELQENKMLFFTIPYDRGWKIKVNGKQEELSRVNIGFTGIILPAGKHEIELYYVPEYSKITSMISIVSIILFWLFLGFDIYRKRRNKKGIIK